jgi:hypothetical protein
VIKLLHMLSMLGFVSFFLISGLSSKGSSVTYQRLKISTGFLMLSLLLSVILGVTLVHQRGYFFTTPWIEAALLWSVILFCLLLAIFYLQRKRILSSEFSFVDKIRLWTLQLLSFSIIVVIIHDAVTKTAII